MVQCLCDAILPCPIHDKEEPVFQTDGYGEVMVRVTLTEEQQFDAPLYSRHRTTIRVGKITAKLPEAYSVTAHGWHYRQDGKVGRATSSYGEYIGWESVPEEIQQAIQAEYTRTIAALPQDMKKEEE